MFTTMILVREKSSSSCVKMKPLALWTPKVSDFIRQIWQGQLGHELPGHCFIQQDAIQAHGAKSLVRDWCIALAIVQVDVQSLFFWTVGCPIYGGVGGPNLNATGIISLVYIEFVF